MRIGLDVRSVHVAGGSANRGIGRYVTDLAEGLLTLRPQHELVLFGLAGRKLPGRLAEISEHSEVVPVDGPIYHEMPKPWYMHIPKIRSNQKLLGRLHSRAAAAQRLAFEAAVAGARLDVLHLPTAVEISSYPEGDFPCPTVMTFLDAIPIVFRSLYYDRWGAFLQRFYDRQVANLAKADHVVAISEASRQDAIHMAGIPPDRVSVVYPAVGPEFSIPASEATVTATRQKYGIDRRFFLFCSVADRHKNHVRILEAFREARAKLKVPHQLVFVAPPGVPEGPLLVDQATQMGLAAGEFVVTGRVEDDELIALFQSATAVVSPSLIEGFGLPAAQAMAAGTPPIVSNRYSQPEVVGDAGVQVDPENVAAIEEAMIYLANDQELRSRLAALGRERSKLFVPERQVESMLRIYQGVAE